VVLLTARVDVEQNFEGILVGADDYIAKPFDTRLLVSRCNSLVNSRKMLQEKFSGQPDLSSKVLATNSLDKEMMDMVTEIIERNLDNPDFNITMFAHEMAMSRTNLFAKIKSITGQTPNEFIMTLRLKKGAYMLRNNPELSISEIADRTGFTSSNYFSRCFNELYHVRPLNYRKGKDE
jgi:transcriptional regulator GlxA family with amidase domain